MPGPLRASVLVIGDEILSGHVRDTNSGWLAQRFQAHGVPLERIVTVADEVGDIVEALDDELARTRPRLVVTSGGVGSTPDDRTYEAVASALHVPLVVDVVLERRVAGIVERARTAGVDIGSVHADSLLKMARVPQGAYLLAGEGFTPGVAVDLAGGIDAGGATVVILPGIPAELRRITTQGIEPALLAGRGRPQHVVELRHPYPESVINATLEEIVADLPAVHVGSYPGRVCVVRLKGPKELVETAASMVESAIEAVGRLPGAETMAAAWQAQWPGAAD